MRIALGLAGLVACTPIYDAQFNDRADELEQFRTDFRPEEDNTTLLEAGGERVFWVATKRPEDQTFLHSLNPDQPGSELVYAWSMNDSDYEDFQFGDQLIARCSFSSTRAFRVNDPAQAEPGEAPGNAKDGSPCAVEGNSVWMIASNDAPEPKNALYKWLPGTDIAETDPGLFTLESAGIAAQISAFGVIGNLMVAAEVDGDLYTVDIAAKRATYLGNEDHKVNGKVFFDERGALYETSTGPRYVEFNGTDTPVDRSFDEMVADGGYHLNYKHGDIQQPAGNGEYFMHGRHIVYRGQRGIFAYGLDTHNVVDLLLDRGEGIDLELAYHGPVVTTNDQLFVFGTESFGIGFRGPVFQLDLADRLK